MSATLFAEYVGQPRIKNLLTILIANAQFQKTSLNHILLYGPSGYGKTTLAQLIGRALKVPTQVINGNLLQTPAQIISLLSNLKVAQIIFIDEIHAISQRVAEILYPAMNERRLSVFLGKGYHAKVVNLKLPRFTLIGATTLVHKMLRPLKSRFAHVLTMDPYTIADIKTLTTQKLTALQLPVAEPIIDVIATRSRLNPRTTVHLVGIFRAFWCAKGAKLALSPSELSQFLIQIGIYPTGVTQLEINYLRLLLHQPGRCLSLITIAQIINYSQPTIIRDIEPFLLQKGLLVKTTRGRQLTKTGIKLLASIKE